MKSRFPVALTKCFFCLKSDQILISTMSTTLPEGQSRVEAAHGKVINMDPCNECEGYMAQGVILITIDDDKSGKDWNKPPVKAEHCRNRGSFSCRGSRCTCGCPGCSAFRWMPNPHRTGGWFVVKDEAIKRMIHPDEMASWALKHRFMFIEHGAAELLGLFGDEGRRKAEERIEFTL